MPFALGQLSSGPSLTLLRLLRFCARLLAAGPAAGFRYLNQSGCVTIAGVSDGEQLKATLAV